jgi:hypothetical protein
MGNLNVILVVILISIIFTGLGMRIYDIPHLERERICLKEIGDTFCLNNGYSDNIYYHDNFVCINDSHMGERKEFYYTKVEHNKCWEGTE